MKRFLQTVLAALGFCSGCSEPKAVSPAEFTKDFQAELQRRLPEHKVVVVKDFELKISKNDGGSSTSFLDNAYETYRQNPSDKRAIITRFVEAFVETTQREATGESIDQSRIVPVIKDRPWLAETRQAMQASGAKELPEHVFDEVNAKLVVVYAEDSPKNIRYLSPKDLETLKVERRELRAIACTNLKRILPQIERKGSNGLFMVSAGGDYEASLLLFDFVWDDLKREVKGDVVVAIPTRDLLLATGSQDADALARLNKLVAEVTSKGSYRLTHTLFTRTQDGQIIEFKSPSQ